MSVWKGGQLNVGGGAALFVDGGSVISPALGLPVSARRCTL